MITVWESTLDGVWKCLVVRSEPYRGVLTVSKDGEEPILTMDVGLSYGARFGPDVSDVEEWGNICIEAVDRHGGAS